MKMCEKNMVSSRRWLGSSGGLGGEAPVNSRRMKINEGGRRSVTSFTVSVVCGSAFGGQICDGYAERNRDAWNWKVNFIASVGWQLSF